MNLYQIDHIEKEIEQIAIENDGELTDEQWQMLIEAQTKSLDKVENVCKYIRHLEQFEQKAKEEIARINELKAKAARRRENIKKYLTPYVVSRGKIDVGTFKLSTRKSKSVDINEVEFHNSTDTLQYVDTKTISTISKKRIGDDLKAGKEIPGASLKESINLQIK